MKTKLFLYFFLCSIGMADTNFVVYVLSTGAKVSYDRQYDIDQNAMAPDGLSFKTITSGTNACGILSTTDDPSKIVNISELKSKTILVPSDFLKQSQAAKEITPAVQALLDCINKRLPATNQITAAELIVATTNQIQKTQKQQRLMEP